MASLKRKLRKTIRGRPRRDRQEILKDGYRISAYEKCKEKSKKPYPLRINVVKEKWMGEGEYQFLRIVYLIEHYLKLPDGKPFVLRPWQKEILGDLFGNLNEDGTRQYRKAYISMARKNAKTTLCAAIILYFLCVLSEDEPFMEIYSCAGNREQASIVFSIASAMVKQSAELSKILRVVDYTKKMRNVRTDASYMVISREHSTKHGVNAKLIIFDEVFNQPDDLLWSAMEKSQGAQSSPLMIGITTAGSERESLCRRLYEYGKRVNAGEVNDPTFYCKIYEAPEEADWTDEKTWYLANPALGDFRSLEEMRQMFNRAKEIPVEENSFRNQYLNQWTQVAVRWMSTADWMACGEAIDIDSLGGRLCYAGIDLSASKDLTACVLLFRPQNPGEKWKVLPFFWIPGDNVEERGRRDRAPYPLWVKQGLIMTTAGNVVDYRAIREKINELNGQFKILEIGIDPWNKQNLAPFLQEDGFTIFDVGQGYKSMSPAMKELERLILSRNITHGGNAVLSWMFENVIIVTDPAGNIKPDKSSRNARIDGIVGLIIALFAALQNPEPDSGKSVYEDHGILTVY